MKMNPENRIREIGNYFKALENATINAAEPTETPPTKADYLEELECLADIASMQQNNLSRLEKNLENCEEHFRKTLEAQIAGCRAGTLDTSSETAEILARIAKLEPEVSGNLPLDKQLTALLLERTLIDAKIDNIREQIKTDNRQPSPEKDKFLELIRKLIPEFDPFDVLPLTLYHKMLNNQKAYFDIYRTLLNHAIATGLVPMDSEARCLDFVWVDQTVKHRKIVSFFPTLLGSAFGKTVSLRRVYSTKFEPGFGCPDIVRRPFVSKRTKTQIYTPSA